MKEIKVFTIFNNTKFKMKKNETLHVAKALSYAYNLIYFINKYNKIRYAQIKKMIKLYSMAIKLADKTWMEYMEKDVNSFLSMNYSIKNVLFDIEICSGYNLYSLTVSLIAIAKQNNLKIDFS